MNDKQIEQLLTAFYNGTASEEDELKLKAFFMSGDVPACWCDEQKCIKTLFSVSEVPLPEGLSTRLEARVDSFFVAGKRNKMRRVIYWGSGVAAAVLLCFCFYMGDMRLQPQPKIADTYTNPHDAAVAAGKALTLMSAQLNKGIKQVNEAEREVDKINRILNKNLINE